MLLRSASSTFLNELQLDLQLLGAASLKRRLVGSRSDPGHSGDPCVIPNTPSDDPPVPLFYDTARLGKDDWNRL